MANRAKGEARRAQRRLGPQPQNVTAQERVCWARLNLRAACERLRHAPGDRLLAESVVASLTRLESAEHAYQTFIDCPTCHTPRALPRAVSVAAITEAAEFAERRRGSRL